MPSCKPIRVLHLTASPFFGGPERVILDIVRTQALQEYDVESLVVSFHEGGRCEAFMRVLADDGIRGAVLKHDMPRLGAAWRELVQLLRNEEIDLLCAHGHKSRLLGWWAARCTHIPVIGVSHGWTWQDWKTSLYEKIDQWVHRRMNAVVAVSQGQADKIIRSGTPKSRVTVIHNAIDTARFQGPFDKEYRQKLLAFFPASPEIVIGAAGRLSPEKGYDVLVEAFRRYVDLDKQAASRVGLVLFGDGFLRNTLQNQIDRAGLSEHFKMVGFTAELDRFMPHFDMFVQSSHTEGFPCVNIEAMAACVPVVATAVGGVPEQISNGQSGILVPANDAVALASALQMLVEDADLRRTLGQQGRQRAEAEFTCTIQAQRYFELFQKILAE